MCNNWEMVRYIGQNYGRIRKWQGIKKILSIRVAELFATRVGLEMSGKKEPDMNISRNSCDLLSLTCINKSKLKSPMIKDFFFYS